MNDETSWDEVDRELLESLARIAAVVDPEPTYLRDWGRAALSIRRVDAELADLVADSQLASGSVRSSGLTSTRILAFARDAVALDVQAHLSDTGWQLIGVLEGADPGGFRVDVEAASAGVLSAVLDPLGRFTLEGVPSGLIRLRIVGGNDGLVGGNVDVTTEWVRLAADGPMA